ncbi:hypothetical protein Tco_0702190 [Tanacetum coccineum]|uniref:Reverse transcriptase domain-containing protein n=1 Tax=Tanacetum coccineum TaxID=301880 RepID=A0ABQ4XVA4_9ASTR
MAGISRKHTLLGLKALFSVVDNLSHRIALGMERDCQHGLYKAGMGSSRVLSDFAEKYGSKNRVLAGFGIGGKSGKEKVYKLGCDRERLKMIKEMHRVEYVRPSGVIIEDCVSDDEDIFQSNDLQATNKPSFKRIKFTNARNESVKPKQAEKPSIITQNPKKGSTQGVTNALATRDADRNTNGDDSHNSGTGVRRTERVAREYTYPDFMKCQPLNFKGTERVIKLIQWFEKMETVFSISNCSVENQIKPEKKMTDKYSPRGEIKKLEVELWNLKVKGTDVIGYNQHFQELALLCVRMFPEESDKIKRYIGGLPDMIHGSVVASRHKTMQEAIEIATELMGKKIRTFAE